jgi:hypothetical protein
LLGGEILTREEFLTAIRKYADSINPTSGFGIYLRQMSYSKWAANELLAAIKSNPGRSVHEVISMFIYKMNEYSLKGSESYLFSVAYDIAVDIYDKYIL